MRKKRLIKLIRVPLVTYIVAIVVVLIMQFTSGIKVNTGSSILLALTMSAINFSFFLLSFQLSYKKSNKTFLLFTMGGIGVRLVIMLGAVFISLKFLNVDLLAFIFGFFISYFFLLFYEISIVRSGLGE